MISEAQWLAALLVSEDNEPHAWPYLATVVRNRVESKRYPNTYREAVLQPDQFSHWNDYQHMRDDPERLYLSAIRGAHGRPLTHGLEEAFCCAHRTISLSRHRLPFSSRVLYFYAPKAMKPTGSQPWWWAVDVGEDNTIVIPQLPRWVFGEAA